MFLVGSLALLVLLAGVVSCYNGTTVVREVPVGDAITGGPAVISSEAPVDVVEPPGFLRHHEAGFVNYGNNYVYGDLLMSEGCLRVSRLGYADPATANGFVLVWPVPFGLRINDGVVEVVDGSGAVVASEGDTVRVSGSFAPSGTARLSGWAWVGEKPERCSGPYWVVGDEVSAGAGLSSDPSQSWVFFPRLRVHRGPKSHPEALLEGELTLSGRCLRISGSNLPGQYLVVWPPGFVPVGDYEGVAAVNGGGRVMARVGEQLSVGGYSPERTDYLGNTECRGQYFYAYEVTSGR